MGMMDNLLNKMKMVDDQDEDYDDYDDYDEYEDEDDEKNSSRKSLFRKNIRKSSGEESEDLSPKSAYSVPEATSGKGSVTMMRTGKGGEVSAIAPKGFEDANAVADVLLSHKAVILNLEGIDLAAAQRIIDFAAGACYTLGGSLQRISKKIYIVAPSDMNLSGDFLESIGEVDLSSVSMLK